MIRAFYTPVRWYVDKSQRDNNWDEIARAGWYVGLSPENSTAPYVWDGHAHFTAGGGIQFFESFIYDSTARSNDRISDADWQPTQPVPPPASSYPPSDATDAHGQPLPATATLLTTALPASLTRPRRVTILKPERLT